MWTSAILYSSRPATQIERIMERTRRVLASMSEEETQRVAADLVYAVEPYRSPQEFELALEAAIGQSLSQRPQCLENSREPGVAPEEHQPAASVIGDLLVGVPS